MISPVAIVKTIKAAIGKGIKNLVENLKKTFMKLETIAKNICQLNNELVDLIMQLSTTKSYCDLANSSEKST